MKTRCRDCLYFERNTKIYENNRYRPGTCKLKNEDVLFLSGYCSQGRPREIEITVEPRREFKAVLEEEQK